MKRQLRYNGVSLRMMSKADLRGQLIVNRERMMTRAAILGILGALTMIADPLLGLFPLGVCALTSFWLWQNNRAIESELEARE